MNGNSAKKQQLLCFSHLGWNFVYQRPQHLISRFANLYDTYYFEEPREGEEDSYIITEQDNVKIVQVFLKDFQNNRNSRLEAVISRFLKEQNIESYISWYYTPMALEFTENLNPEVLVYDSMDELSAFRFAPPQMIEMETLLLKKADVVFTGGRSLHKAKEQRHHNIHLFPSSIDKQHFGSARNKFDDPEDQKEIPRPRLGFFGVLDERFDTGLLKSVAEMRPDWHFVIIGPVVKINENDLPRAENIHYLGAKKYADLPQYISHWDIAMMPFAINESTRFISPTKTPEYLAAGLPVISTPINDVVEP